MSAKLQAVCLSLFLSAALFSAAPVWSENEKPAPEADFVIVKYGSLIVESPEPGAKVYIDEIYKGSADTVIEGIIAGGHVISCKTDDKTVSGMFEIKKNETLRVEARFDEGKLVLSREPAREVEKKKPEPVRRVKTGKPAPEPKKVEHKNPVEERRKTHATVMKIDYETTGLPDVKVRHTANQQVISKFSLKKNKSGKYYRTKQNVLLCDAGPCELTWTSSFMYTDETKKQDALLLRWKETVFNGITPAGTSRRDLECCLNGQCWKMEDKTEEGNSRDFSIERYRLTWTPASVIIRRSDLVKEILDAGRSLTDY